MSAVGEIILNGLPLTEREQAEFRVAAPEAEHRFVPMMDRSGQSLPLADPDVLEGATVILGCPDQALVGKLASLRWLQTWSAGVDAYLRPGCFPKGAVLTSAVGAYGPPVAEHMFATLLALLKRLPQYRDDQRAHRFQSRGNVKTLNGATVLVVGAGDIGTQFAALCRAMGARTVGLKRNVCPPPEGVDEIHAVSQLDEWIPWADVVALALPQTPETVHIMDRRRLGLMKEGAVLLNGGRGSAVDPDALLDVLRSGKLWGVGLDVTEPEPLPADSPLWDEEKLLLTPHVAGGLHMEGTRERIVGIALDNLRRYIAGEPLRNRMV